MSINKGTPVAVDGWRGRVERDDGGDVIVCIADGFPPNDYLRGYRTFARAALVQAGALPAPSREQRVAAVAALKREIHHGAVGNAWAEYLSKKLH